MYEKIGYMVALFTIAYLTWQDIKRKEISLGILVISGCMALLFLAAGEQLAIGEITERILPGIVMLTMSLLLKGSIGYGDGVTILVLGLWTSPYCCCFVVVAAFMLAGAYGIFMLIKRRKEKTIPFVPFLLVAMEVFLVNA